MEYKYNGIILTKFDVGETDRIYSIYTLEAGKIKILGKGVRNPNAKLAGNLEPVTYSEIFAARSRGMGKITGVISANNFVNIKLQYPALSRVFYVFGILEKMIAEEEKDRKIWKILLEYLEEMEKTAASSLTDDKLDILTLGFLFKLLDFMGYRVNVEKCVECGKKLKNENNYFAAPLGGVICPDDWKKKKKGVKITSGAIKLIRIFLKNDPRNFLKISAPREDIKNLKLIAGEELRWVM